MKIQDKTRQLIIILLAIISVAVSSSCKKFLDKKNNASLVVPTTLADMQALLDAETMNELRTPCYGEVSSDEYFLKPDTYSSLDLGNQKRYTWRYYFFGTGNDWSACYTPVYTSNLVLDMIKNISRTENNQQRWDNVKGSALFYRSYYFLCLLWNYAKAYDNTTASNDLGIALRLTSNFNVPSIRSSNEECYQQIISDTKAAIPLLPSLPLHPFRPSKAAAYGLLARCYLSMRQYSNALLYADSCLQLKGGLMNFNADPEIDVSNLDHPVFKRFNKETIFYTEMNFYFYFYITAGDSRIDTSLMQAYAPEDLRLSNFYQRNNDSYHSFTGSYTGSSYTMFSGIATDEMYLIRAECLVREGKIQKGLADINTLLETRFKESSFIPYTADTQQEALTLVLEERKKELVMRGLRWIDLKRINKEGANITLKRKTGEGEYILLPNANFYALPIPEDIIKLTGMPQNPL